MSDDHVIRKPEPPATPTETVQAMNDAVVLDGLLGVPTTVAPDARSKTRGVRAGAPVLDTGETAKIDGVSFSWADIKVTPRDMRTIRFTSIEAPERTPPHVGRQRDPRVQATHMAPAFEPDRLRLAIDFAAPIVARLADRHGFNALVYRGQSGACYAWPLSYATGIGVACVRKGGEGSHSPFGVEGFVGAGVRYAFIDDFISSGKTYRAVTSVVGEANIKAVLLMQRTIYYDGPAHEPVCRAYDCAAPVYYLNMPSNIDPYGRCF